MSNIYQDFAVKMAEVTPQPEDYTGEDGLLYCKKTAQRKMETLKNMMND